MAMMLVMSLAVTTINVIEGIKVTKYCYFHMFFCNRSILDKILYVYVALLNHDDFYNDASIVNKNFLTNCYFNFWREKFNLVF